jgi:hypothetical protein
VQLRYIGIYVLLRDECDRDNVVPLHIIMCRNYFTGIMILCYVYTLNSVQSTLSYITLCNFVDYYYFVSMKKRVCCVFRWSWPVVQLRMS